MIRNASNVALLQPGTDGRRLQSVYVAEQPTLIEYLDGIRIMKIGWFPKEVEQPADGR